MISPLKLLVLHYLSIEPLNGYQLSDKVKVLTGKKPSSGSIYPLLNILIAKNWVAPLVEGKKVMCLTKLGKERLEKEKEIFETEIAKLLKILRRTSEK